MIYGSKGKLTIYVGSKKVKVGYLGDVKIYPNSFLEVTQSLTFIAAGETKQLVINCNDDQAWSLVVPEGFTANTTSGSGPTTVNITATNNTTETAKKGTITVTSVDDLSVTVSLSQAAGVMAEEYTEWTIHSVQLTATTTEFSATGGTATCSTHVSEDRFKITKWNGIETNRATENQVRDVSTEATYVRESGTAGSISGRTITFGNNATTSTQTAVFTATYDGYQSSITCTQAAGSQVYNDISITTFSYPQVGAGGGTSSPSLAYSQVWTWNEVAGSGGTITSGASVSYSGSGVNASSGVATVGSKGTSVSDVTTATTATVTVSMNGKSASASANVTQEANVIVSYGRPEGSILTVGQIPASGGTISSGSLSGTVTQYRTFTSMASDTVTNPPITASSYSAPVSAASKGTTVSGVTNVGTLTYYYTCNGVQGFTSATVTQAANDIVSTSYGVPVVTITSVSDIPAAGGTVNSGSYSYYQTQTYTYTSGSTLGGPNITSGGSASWTSVSASSKGTTQSSRSAAGTITCTVSQYGQSGSGSATVYQAENVPVSTQYQILHVNYGSSIAWTGGSTTISAKPQANSTYSSGSSTGFVDVSGTLSATTSSSGFSVGSPSTSGYVWSFVVTASNSNSTSSRQGLIYVSDHVGNSIEFGITQTGGSYKSEFVNGTTANLASQIPRIGAMYISPTWTSFRNYNNAIKTTNLNSVTYPKVTLVCEHNNVSTWFVVGWSNEQSADGCGFISSKIQDFISNYEYTYTTLEFYIQAKTSGGLVVGKPTGSILVEKQAGDFPYTWPDPQPSSVLRTYTSDEIPTLTDKQKEFLDSLSDLEREYIYNMTAEEGDVGQDKFKDLDIAALCKKINDNREPDTHTYKEVDGVVIRVS